jgi:hypothetical protein
LFSFLDFSALRFLQAFRQNALFTNVHLYISEVKTQHAGYGTKILKYLSHLLPLIASIDSIEFSCELIDIIIYKG